MQTNLKPLPEDGSSGPLRFSELLRLWLETNRVHQKRATVCKYRSLIETHILPELGDVAVEKISAPMINAFLQRKLDAGRLDGSGGLSPAYVSSLMLVITSALRFGAQEGLCRLPQSKIYRPTARRRALTVLEPEEQRRLEAELLREPTPVKLGVMISLYTGLRVGEVCALRWEDVDLEENILHVRHTVARVEDPSGLHATVLILDSPKTPSSYRDIPIFSRLRPLLQAAEKLKVSAYVVSDRESFVPPRSYEFRYHRLLQSCGIRPVNYHALRHTFATRCVEAGVDIKTLSEVLGHASASVTLNVYVHSSLEQKRRQLEKLDLALGWDSGGRGADKAP